MLVLTRSLGETIVIGKNAEATVKVLGVKGKQVRLGIDASSNIPVHRSEVYQRIMREGGL